MARSSVAWLTRIGGVARLAFKIFRARGARFLGAAVAFYALFSAAPMVVVVLHVVGAVTGRARAEGALFTGLEHWLSPEGIVVLRSLARRLDDLRGSAGVVGAALLVYAGTRLLRALKRSLNLLLKIDSEKIDAKRTSVVRYALRYGSALALMLVLAIFVALLVIVKGAFAFVDAYGRPTAHLVIGLADWVLSVAITFALFWALLVALPDERLSARISAVGALVGTALFAAGSWVVTAYVRHGHTADVYGGAGAVVMAMIWVYYSAQAFFVGASVAAALRESPGARGS